MSARKSGVRFIIAMVKMTRTEQALRLAKKLGLVRPKDLAPFGIAPVYLRRLVHTGELVQSSRGVYRLPGHKATPHHHLAEICKRFPGGVVCLLSALHFHGLLKKPPEVWLAIDRKARRPTADELAIRFVRFSKQGMEEGIEKHRIEGVTVPITSCCRTVADAFRYRNKIGLNLAIDALRACIRQHRCLKEDLLKCAAACRISTVITPYVEALAPPAGAARREVHKTL
jgi:predicted transcriptional regulator of viral defense system